MNTPDIEYVKKTISDFITNRMEKFGYDMTVDDIQTLCEQITEFMMELFGTLPESFFKRMELVLEGCRKPFRQPFRTLGVNAFSMYDEMYDFIAENFPALGIKKRFNTVKDIGEILQKIMAAQVDEMWPEYKDRWKESPRNICISVTKTSLMGGTGFFIP